MAFEVLHTICRKIGGKKGLMAFMLDMSKAYDRVEWCFLKAIMEKVWFSNHWVGETCYGLWFNGYLFFSH